MKGRILVLNTELSGVNTYIFSQLKKKGWELIVINVPFPKIGFLLALFFSFSPNIFRWRYRYKKKIRDLNKYPWMFLQKTRLCQQILKHHTGQYNLILQISGTFAPCLDYHDLDTPFVTFNDYTVALSKKYPEWAPLPSYEKKWLELEKGLFENARFIFTVSLNTRNSLIIDYGIEPQKIVQVPYGPTIEDKLDDVIMRDRNSILFVGKDFKRKGGVILLKAFEKVKKEIKDARLIIVGPRKDDLKINQPGVKVIGYLHDKKEVNDLFKRASVFVLPSFCEPFGLVFLEAMAYQLPCIGTTVDAIPEIIEDEETGFLVSPGDIDTLAEKIIILLRDSELSQKMGKAGNQRLHQKFQWNYLGEKIDNVLKQCL